jgi:hypothetical protein
MLHAQRTLLLRLHAAKRLPPSTLHRHDQQPGPANLPAQNPPMRRLHRKLQRHSPRVLGKFRRRNQSHQSREATKKLAQRKEAMADRQNKPKVQRPVRRLVQQRNSQSERSVKPPPTVIPSEVEGPCVIRHAPKSWNARTIQYNRARRRWRKCPSEPLNSCPSAFGLRRWAASLPLWSFGERPFRRNGRRRSRPLLTNRRALQSSYS